MEKAKCSIIVAEYDNGRYFNELYASVCRQTYSNWELIIADDCSSDDTLEIITPYLKDIRIKLVKHEVNLGGGAAFRTAAQHASGEIIAMLGADDALVDDALESIMKQHELHPEISLLYCKLIICDKDLKPVYNQPSFNIPPKGKTLLEYSSGIGWQSFKREYYLKTEGFDSFFKRAIDQDLNFKMEEVGQIGYLDKPLYLYRKMENSISQGASSYVAKDYYYKAVYKAYARRKKTSFQNLSSLSLLKFKSQHNFIKYKIALQEHSSKGLLYLLKSFILFPPTLFNLKKLRIIALDTLYTLKDAAGFKKV